MAVAKGDGQIEQKKINQVFVYRGLKRMAVDQAEAGDIVVISGIADISIGETICDPADPQPLEMIHIEEPTLSMYFMVNKSPFAGKSGKFVTSRHIRERLNKELEVNVGLKVEETDSTDSFKVSGRGELHLSILIENMRREGYELAVSKPEVIMRRGDHNQVQEPIEEVVLSVPDEYSGIGHFQAERPQGHDDRRCHSENGYSPHLEYLVPTRGLLGYRSEFINDTQRRGHDGADGLTPFDDYVGRGPAACQRRGDRAGGRCLQRRMRCSTSASVYRCSSNRAPRCTRA